MKRSTAHAARELQELVGWLRRQVSDEVRSLVRQGHALRASSPQQRRAWLSAYLAGNLAYLRRVRPVAPRLLLTLGLPVLTTLALLQVVPAVQSSHADGCTWYNVQAGDTLSKIGARFGASVADLAATNHIPNPDLIFAGQRLCIPSTASAGSSSTNGPVTNGPVTNGANVRASGEAAFVAAALPYAQRAAQQTRWPTSLILAQWGLEQGWKTPGYTGFNWGNVAALPGEPTVGGIQKVGSPAAFAYATTPEDGLRYYMRVAQLGYYSAVGPAAASQGVDAAARALGRSPWDAGHYTDRGDPGSSLLNMLRTYNLYQYDQ